MHSQVAASKAGKNHFLHLRNLNSEVHALL